MKFAVSINGKKFPVQVMREPKNASVLSNFDYDGRTYKGIQEQFNGLRFNKDKNNYTAISIIVDPSIVLPPRKEIVVVEVMVEEYPEKETIICEEEIEETEDEEDNTFSYKGEFLHNLAQEAERMEKIRQEQIAKASICDKKITFYPRWSALFPESETFGEGLFERNKICWIKQHGSEHLKMAYDMRCKCDSLYIKERTAKEYPDWEVHDLLSYYEIDSPDFGILTFLKNYSNYNKEMLRMFKSRIVLAAVDPYDENEPFVIITDYLGHCDLSIKFVDLVEKYGDNC